VPKPYPQQRVHFEAIKFRNEQDGVVAFRLSEGRYVNCVTHDGGRTWQFSHFDAPGATPSIVENHIFWCVLHGGRNWPTLQKDTEAITFPLPEEFRDNNRSVCAAFIDDVNGSTMIKERGKTTLIVTDDGAKTFKIVPLPTPNSISVRSDLN